MLDCTLTAEVSITLSEGRPLERRFFTARGGASVCFLEERCGYRKINRQKKRQQLQKYFTPLIDECVPTDIKEFRIVQAVKLPRPEQIICPSTCRVQVSQALKYSK